MTELSAKPGQREAPQRVLRARSREGGSEVEALVVIAGTGLGVEMFVAGPGVGDELVAEPEVDPGPVHGLEVNGDDLPAEV